MVAKLHDREVAPKVCFSLEGEVARIRMDDGKVNAIDPAFVAELGAALDCAEVGLARAVLLEGRNRAFSAGLDLKVAPGLEPIARRAFLREFGRVVVRLFQFPRPVVAVLEGPALAGGAVLALAADLRIAEPGRFRIGLPGVALGVPMPGFSVEIARAVLSPNVQTRLIALGEVFDGPAALAGGVIDRLVSPGEAAQRGHIEAHRLAALPEPAFAHTKRVLRAPAAAAAMGREEEDLDAMLLDGPFASGSGWGEALTPDLEGGDGARGA